MFGYELNKMNNYLMSSKPIIVIGKKKNLSNKRGNFIFVQKKSSALFEKKLLNIKNNYQFFLEIAKLNKLNLLLRNDPEKIFNETVQQLNKLKNV